MDIDRKAFLDSLGGADAVSKMDSESRADALESRMMAELNTAIALKHGGHQAPAAFASGRYPTAAEVEARVETKPYRAGAGFLMVPRTGENVKRLPPMPANPTLIDFFKLRFMDTAHHVLQSANLAMRNGMSEEIILACLLHDVVQELIRTDHGWWGAQLFEPYVPEKVCVRDPLPSGAALLRRSRGGIRVSRSVPATVRRGLHSAAYIEATYQMVRKHKWYMEPRMVTVNDLYAFDPNVVVTIDRFLDIIGRHFKQPKEGLGNDGSPVAHMWRTITNPDQPL